ncbi:MAG: toprim domain-containing protein [Anaerolineae bacterium]|nr:toprim domain-containing protein [Anaerolineae bacterium]
MIDVTQAVVGRWPGVLLALGVDEKYLRNRHGPCPACGGKDRYRFDDREGRGTWFCNNCGAGDGFALLERVKGVPFKEAAQLVRGVLGSVQISARPRHAERDERAAMRAMWAESRPVHHGDEVDRYLAGRGLRMTDYPSTLRCHPGLPYYDEGTVIGRFSCMLAMVVNAENKPIAIHRTYLQDGRKAPVESPRKVIGKLGTSAVVRLQEPQGRLAVAEGIETALTVHKRFGMRVWACINANMLEAFRWPTGVSLDIFGDNDESYTGQRAAFTLAYRARMAGIQTHVHIPNQPGHDWADEVSREGTSDRTI